jgi:ribosome-associated heat shock protein Hsp15
MSGSKPANGTEPLGVEPLRLDKWLWAARFYKTRSLARQAIDGGHVRANGTSAKPSRPARVGDIVEIKRGEQAMECTIRALSHFRGPASVAANLYEETPASVERREREAARRHGQTDPQRPGGARPTKRQRRTLDRWRGGDEGNDA